MSRMQTWLHKDMNSWEIDRYSAGQEDPCFYGTRRFINRLKGTVLWPVSSQLCSVYTHTSISQRSILILSSHLALRLPSCLFPWEFPTKNFVCISHLRMRTINLALLSLSDLITLVTSGGKYKIWNPSLCNFLRLSEINSLLEISITSELSYNGKQLQTSCGMRQTIIN